MHKVLGLAAIFAIAVLAGCSSQSLPTSSNIPAGHLTGTMSDWTSAICERGSGPVPMAHGPRDTGQDKQRRNSGSMPAGVSVMVSTVAGVDEGQIQKSNCA
jgi:hypothetical protein